MKRLTPLLALAAMLIATGASSADQERNMVPCSVCGYLVPKAEALTAEHEGTTHHFCEAGCKAYFLMDPTTMAAGMDMDPVCGMTVKKAGSIEAVHEGRRMHFCANACKDKYFANPADHAINYDVVANAVKPQKEMKYSGVFEGRPYSFLSEANKIAFEKNPDAYIYAECPVCGKVFLRKDARAKTAYDGKTHYFCGNECRDNFKKDPKQYSGPAMGAKAKKEAGCAAAEAGACPKARTCCKK